MTNWDALAVLFFGLVTDRFVYPMLYKRGIYLDHMQKYMISMVWGLLALLYFVLCQYLITDDWKPENKVCVGDEGNHISLSNTTTEFKQCTTEQGLSVFIQIPGFALVALGEIFANVIGLELAYKVAPQSLKGFSAAIALIFQGCLPGVVYTALAAALPQYQVDQYGCSSQQGCPELVGTKGV